MDRIHRILSAALVADWRNGEHTEAKTIFKLGKMTVLLTKVEKLLKGPSF